jgi:CheY-like chemotaxis protein
MVLRGDYALVLMDCQMPVKDGYTATREIRQHEQATGKHQVIVALTVHSGAGERERVLAAGMDDYLAKPLEAAALARILTLHAHAEQSAAAAQRERPAAPAVVVAERGPVLALDVARSRALIDLCLRETPKQLALLADTLQRGAAAELRAAAHKLKGTAMALAADHMAALAERLQRCAEQRRLDGAAPLVKQQNAADLLVEEALRREHASASA